MGNRIARRSNVHGGASCAALAIALLAAGTAGAQTSPTPQAAPSPQEAPVAPEATPAEQTPTDDIVVTGIRASLAGALSAKRNSTQVIDAISAEDIGKFPDKNIGEAVQRVTGVQLTRGAGEGQFVSIRGADPALTRVEVNGQTALSTVVGSGRQVDFRELPAEFVSRLEVVKSVSASDTEGGLGGTVRIITRRPFDSREGYLAGSAQAVYGELASTLDPKFALIGSKLFANNTIGVLLSGTYEKRSLNYDWARTTGWRRIDGNTGVAGSQDLNLNSDATGDFYPDIPRYTMNREKTERYALNGIAEYRPNDDFRAWVEGTYTRGKQTLDSQFLQLTTALPATPGATGAGVGGSGVVTSSAVIGPDDTTTRVTFNNRTTLDNGAAIAVPAQLAVALRNILGTIDRTTFNGQAGFDWQVGQLKITGRGNYARSRAYNDEINATGDYLGVSTLTIDYDNPQQGPNIILPFDPREVAGLNRLTVLRQPRFNRQEEYGGKIDLEYTPEESFITSLKAGAERRNLSSDSELYSVTRALNGFSGTTTVSNTSNFSARTDVVQTTETPAVVTARLQDIVRQNATLGDHDFFKTGELGFTGIQRWLNLGLDVANAVGIPDPFTSPLPLDTWKVTDKNLAGYFQTAFRFDLGFEVSGIVGARVVNTRTISRGNRLITQAGQPNQLVPVEFEGEYTEFLPAFNMKAELIPNKLLARGAITEVLARPQQGQLAPSFRTDVVGRTGSRGNPELQPFRATQYDLGLEYYLNRTSYLSAAFFRKEIGSFIFNTTQPETIDGITYTITLPVNGSQQVNINGIEVGGQLALDFLPGFFSGFGVTANFTYQKDKGFESRDLITGGPLPFPGLSRKSYNASVFYEKGPVSLRGSYNWRDLYLITPVGRGNNPEFGEAYGQFDANATINLTDQVSAFLEGVNIFDSTRAENANSIYRRTLIETFGRRVYAGVRVRL